MRNWMRNEWKRSLSFEPLEQRALLSVSAGVDMQTPIATVGSLYNAAYYGWGDLADPTLTTLLQDADVECYRIPVDLNCIYASTERPENPVPNLDYSRPYGIDGGTG